MSDFTLENHGSIFLLAPVSASAMLWARENLPEDAPTFGLSVAIEHRYIDPIVEGIVEAGLSVE